MTEALTDTQRPKQTFLLIQVLRGVAATMVVAHHDSILAAERLHAGTYRWNSGAAGVDIFFVISGFVMALSVARLGSGIAQAAIFLKRRLERIVPLYWLATSAKVVLLLIVPTLSLRREGLGWYHVLASYLFLPNKSAAGVDLPLILVGWTLNLEMIFYLLFAAALALRLRLLPFLVPLLGFIAFLPVFYAVSPFWVEVFNPIIFEFIFGILLFRLTQHGWRLPWLAAVLLLLSGFAAILLRPQTLNTPARPFYWGIPALLIVASALSLERHIASRVPAWLLEIGDGSYSIYLTHTFVLPLAAVILLALHQTGPGSRLPAMLLGVPLSVVCGLAVYRLVELPIINHFRGRHRMVPPSHA